MNYSKEVKKNEESNFCKTTSETCKENELSIPEPISVSQLMSDAYLNNISEIPNIIVDDAEFVLREILSTRKVRSVEAIAICTDDPCDEMI